MAVVVAAHANAPGSLAALRHLHGSAVALQPGRPGCLDGRQPLSYAIVPTLRLMRMRTKKKMISCFSLQIVDASWPLACCGCRAWLRRAARARNGLLAELAFASVLQRLLPAAHNLAAPRGSKKGMSAAQPLRNLPAAGIEALLRVLHLVARRICAASGGWGCIRAVSCFRERVLGPR